MDYVYCVLHKFFNLFPKVDDCFSLFVNIETLMNLQKDISRINLILSMFFSFEEMNGLK